MFQANDSKTTKLLPRIEHLLPGTFAGIKCHDLKEAASVLWMPPPSSDYEGIDGVLGDAEDNIYVLQATTASEQWRPATRGLERLWMDVNANEYQAANQLVAQLAEELKDVCLSRKGVQAMVWGCVLPLC
ncbi:hypothetical protein AAF712_005180 [Marasmius tenuissimus]|uniref:Uncharacterized protein n=1 Tax=Marasmius tenuissimus TaxID=585030 RepID=A0ABR3A1C8_9AGAR